MAEKRLNTRIFLKHEIEKHWNLATGFFPEKGEVIIYDPDDDHPEPRFKIGNGKDIPKDLPFQAMAAQIITWEADD